MKKLTIILTVISLAFAVINAQMPESQHVVESFIIKSLKSGTNKVSILYNQAMLREIINFEKPDASGIYQPGTKYLYEYNDSGKYSLVQTVVFKDGEWKIYEKGIFEYDGNGNLLKNTRMNIFGNMIDLDTVSVYEYVYDDAGNNIESIYKSNIFGIGFQNNTKISFVYTATNKIKSQVTYKWANNAWFDYSMIHKYYNEYDSITCDSTFKWLDNNWNKSMLYNYGYDSLLNLSLFEIFIYEDSQWTKMEKYRYIYDSSRRRIETIKAIGINNQWVDGGRSTLEFRSDGQIANEKGYNLVNDDWEAVIIKEYIYNNESKNSEIINKSLLNDVWTNTYRYLYEYAAGSILQNLKYQIWKDGIWQNEDISLVFRDKYNEYRHDCYELNLQWLPVSVEELQLQSHINIYPNPANDFITIQPSEVLKTPEGYKVQIFDVLGIGVAQTSSSVFNNNDFFGQKSDPLRIDISHLPTGVYFIRIGDKVVKFVKK